MILSKGLIASQAPFQIFISVTSAESADEVIHEISLEECYAHEKTYAMGVGGTGETIYHFSATREQLGG